MYPSAYWNWVFSILPEEALVSEWLCGGIRLLLPHPTPPGRCVRKKPEHKRVDPAKLWVFVRELEGCRLEVE